MQKALFLVGVIATLLLGVIAAELYPIARIAAATYSLGTSARPESPEHAKAMRYLEEHSDDVWRAFNESTAARSSTSQPPARRPQPSAQSPSSNTR